MGRDFIAETKWVVTHLTYNSYVVSISLPILYSSSFFMCLSLSMQSVNFLLLFLLSSFHA